jgi:O-antigen/teichoic acid export membrane protein
MTFPKNYVYTRQTYFEHISHIFNEVFFPSFSSFKDDKEKIINGYFKSIRLIAMVSISAMTILAFNAQ